MPNDNQKRIKRTEDFLLNPDKVIFESIEELIPAIMLLKEKFENVDFDQIDLLQGKDGKDAVTPKRGVDYFTPGDLQKFEAFILRNLPKPNEDYPTVAAMEAKIKALVAALPVVKGDTGPKGEKGKDGSPDSPQEIIAKVRSLPKDKRWKISDIENLNKVLVSLTEGVDSIEEIKKRIDSLRVTINNGSADGSTSSLNIIYSDTAPTDPADGDLWIDTSVRFDLPVTSADIRSIVALTQAEYDALTPVATTLYVITD